MLNTHCSKLKSQFESTKAEVEPEVASIVMRGLPVVNGWDSQLIIAFCRAWAKYHVCMRF